MADEQDQPALREALAEYLFELWASWADAAIVLAGAGGCQSEMMEQSIRVAKDGGRDWRDVPDFGQNIALKATDELLELFDQHDPCRTALRQAVYMLHAMNRAALVQLDENDDERSKAMASMSRQIEADWKSALKGTGAEIAIVCANCKEKMETANADEDAETAR